jgi:FOG: TPR repeat, SEL1 subfamily
MNPANPEEVNYTIALARTGVANAQYDLGLMYKNGEGLKKNSSKAMKWFKLAGEQGRADALLNIGLMYANGEGVRKNPVEATKWYLLARDRGSEAANQQLILLATENTADKDNKKTPPKSKSADLAAPAQDAHTEETWKQFTEHNHVYSEYELGLAHENGTNREVNDEEAMKCYLSAANKEHMLAQYRLGGIYKSGELVHQDLFESMKWYKRAADQGYAEAQFDLGKMYQEGIGIGVSIEDAINWFKRAGEQGHVEAQLDLALIYESRAEYKEAVHWYSEAAHHGRSEAYCHLAQLYLDGKGVEKNPVESEILYKKAAKLGNEDAKKILDEMLRYHSLA